MVGTSGITDVRLLPEVPRARTWPAFTLVAMVVTASKAICTWPPITAFRISPDALNGTCTISVPLMYLNNSPAI